MLSFAFLIILIKKIDVKKKQTPIETKNSKTIADKSKSPTQRYNKMMNIRKDKKKPGVNKNDPRLNFCSFKNVFLYIFITGCLITLEKKGYENKKTRIRVTTNIWQI